MFSLLLLSATVTVAQPFMLEGRGFDDGAVLSRALNAPVRPRLANEVRYCVKVQGDPMRTTVCRSRRDWRRLGVEPLHG